VLAKVGENRIVQNSRVSNSRNHKSGARGSTVVVGISGGKRNPAAAVAVGGELVGFCEQERLTRVRGGGLRPGQLPEEAVKAVLDLAGVTHDDIYTYMAAEEAVSLSPDLPCVRLDHHQCHAAAAFLTSPYESATILICDQNSNPQVSLWEGQSRDIVNQQKPWRGQGFAALYSEAAQLFGFAVAQEHRLEALARLDPDADAQKIADAFRYRDSALHIASDWKDVLGTWLHQHGPSWPIQHGGRVAGAFQKALGDALVEFVSDIRRSATETRLCVGGGLFYNTYLNTRIASAGLFDDVFVAPNPGNAGLAAGAALAVRLTEPTAVGEAVSPFLGPEYSLEETKNILDNCKLSYECRSEDELVGICVNELMSGRLVGWFQGRMEWGHRALGNRSILANPFSPYVLENLSLFLKLRERHRAYGLSVCEGEAGRYFEGPPRSAWMEYEYRIADRELFRHVMPPGAKTLRVQTIAPSARLFQQLHKAFGAASGASVLVNTSFNGFSEPIVCSPRDAIRVFFGTGLDVLVLGRFILRK
jgi:carbamoyltransferase